MRFRRNGWSVSLQQCVLVGVPSLVLLIFLISFGGNGLDEEQRELGGRLSQIEDRMSHLKMLDQEKRKAFLYMQSQMSEMIEAAEKANVSLGKLSANANQNRSAASRIMILNLSASAAGGGSLTVPGLFNHLPHLLRSSESLAPAVLLTKHRRSVELVIGIPTIKRPKVSYLVTTLRSLIDNLKPEELSNVLIVIFIGELGLTDFVTSETQLLQREFPTAFQTGLFEIVVPPAAYYPPDLESIPATFDDPQERMTWRTKQNLDYAYLMMYCQSRGTFYMQLEDDVITKLDYFSKIRAFIAKNSASINWLLLEFSSLGFIGKLFKTSDLSLVIDFLLMFHRDKPVDWLLDHILYVKLCHPEKSPKVCNTIKAQYRIRHKPSLFQHIGVYSSLRGKTQKLKERDFGKLSYHRAHSNPPAAVSTSLKVYQKYTLDRAYTGQSYFWGLLPQPGDWLRFDLSPPIQLEGITIRSGNPEHPDDMFYNTSLEIKSASPELSSQYPLTQDGYLIVGAISSGGSVECSLNTSQPVTSIRLVVHAESENWVILSEIWIRPLVVAIEPP